MVDAGPAFARDGCQALTERWYSRRMRQVEIKYRRRYTRGHYNYHHNAVIKYRGRSYELEHGSGSDDYDYAYICLLYTSPSPRDRTRSRMPSSA